MPGTPHLLPGPSHQQDFDGAQDVHGPSKGSAQVEAEAHSAPKLWAQRPGNHVVRAASCRKNLVSVRGSRNTVATPGEEGSGTEMGSGLRLQL